MIRPLLKALNKGINGSQTIIIMIFIFVLLNVNSSGDINDNRLLFSVIPLVFMINSYNAKQKNSQIELDHTAT